jgi:hypothetical protein
MKTPLATIGPRIFQESRIQESEYGLAHSAFLLPHSGSWILKFLCRCGVFNGVGALLILSQSMSETERASVSGTPAAGCLSYFFLGGISYR